MIKVIVKSILTAAVAVGGKKLYDKYADGFMYGLVIKYSGGQIECITGSLPSSTLREVKEVLSEFGVTACTLKQAKNGKYKFSSEIPESMYQKLRNILANF